MFVQRYDGVAIFNGELTHVIEESVDIRNSCRIDDEKAGLIEKE